MTRRLALAALCALLAAAAVTVYQFRRTFIADFFHRSAPRPDRAPVLPGGDDGKGLDKAERVRVVLIDGVGRAEAKSMPALNRFCRGGIDFNVDVGFPTVSLPVQVALWTGQSQAQSGVRFVGKRLDPPLRVDIPGQVSKSVAIAELHPYLVHSFQFRRSLPPGDKLKGADKTAWQARFAAEARKEIAGASALAFAHIGQVDVAGHKYGADSKQYRKALTKSDEMLSAWLEAAPPGPETRWFVLSDHGHRPAGGHGGAESNIRITRACVVGGVDRKTGDVHLVDLARAIADSVGATLPESSGRPLDTALANPGGSTLPAPGSRQKIGAIVLALLLLAAMVLGARRTVSAYPWWIVVAYLSLLLIEAVPSLSNPMVYPPRGRAMYMAASPGLLCLAISLPLSMRRLGAARAIIAQIAPALLLALSLVILSGGGHILIGAHGEPPLVPGITAHASASLSVTFAALSVAALTALARALPFGFGRD